MFCNLEWKLKTYNLCSLEYYETKKKLLNERQRATENLKDILQKIISWNKSKLKLRTNNKKKLTCAIAFFYGLTKFI